MPYSTDLNSFPPFYYELIEKMRLLPDAIDLGPLKKSRAHAFRTQFYIFREALRRATLDAKRPIEERNRFAEMRRVAMSREVIMYDPEQPTVSWQKLPNHAHVRIMFRNKADAPDLAELSTQLSQIATPKPFEVEEIDGDALDKTVQDIFFGPRPGKEE